MKAKLLLVLIVMSSCTSFAAKTFNDPNDEFSPMGQNYAVEKKKATCPFSARGNHSDLASIAPAGDAESTTITVRERTAIR